MLTGRRYQKTSSPLAEQRGALGTFFLSRKYIYIFRMGYGLLGMGYELYIYVLNIPKYV
jgi:hypothetical protein